MYMCNVMLLLYSTENTKKKTQKIFSSKMYSTHVGITPHKHVVLSILFCRWSCINIVLGLFLQVNRRQQKLLLKLLKSFPNLLESGLPFLLKSVHMLVSCVCTGNDLTRS